MQEGVEALLCRCRGHGRSAIDKRRDSGVMCQRNESHRWKWLGLGLSADRQATDHAKLTRQARQRGTILTRCRLDP
jgi:hypothetical protein